MFACLFVCLFACLFVWCLAGCFLLVVSFWKVVIISKKVQFQTSFFFFGRNEFSISQEVSMVYNWQDFVWIGIFETFCYHWDISLVSIWASWFWTLTFSCSTLDIHTFILDVSSLHWLALIGEWRFMNLHRNPWKTLHSLIPWGHPVQPQECLRETCSKCLKKTSSRERIISNYLGWIPFDFPFESTRWWRSSQHETRSSRSRPVKYVWIFVSLTLGWNAPIWLAYTRGGPKSIAKTIGDMVFKKWPLV